MGAAALAFVAAAAGFSPQHVVFTWRGDTGTTLTVTYQTLGDRRVASQVFYDTVSHSGQVEAYRYRAEGTATKIPGIDDRFVHRVQLTGLVPGETIWLMAGDPELGTSREFKVRTIAHDDRPLRFIAGGDMDAKHVTREFLREAAKFAPDFVLIGGDVAYDDGRLSNLGLWDSWFSYWTDEMVTPDGFSIPMVVAIGNHEVRGGYRGSVDDAPFYFSFFVQDPEARTFFAHRFGSNLVVLTLDSGHVEAHGGRQAEWLQGTLEMYQNVRYKVAQYHVPLYPSSRSFEDHWSAQGRQHWLPLFDRYGLTVAFENHDHAFKRTHLLRNNEIVPDGGTLYLGDGAWGREQRPITKGGRWYLERAAQVMHFWVVDVSSEALLYRAVDRHGRTFDVYPEDAPGADAAAALFRTFRSHYHLPSGVARGRMEDETGVRTSYPTVLELHNPFPTPMELDLAYHSGPIDAKAVGLPVKIRLEPGARQEHAFTLELQQPQTADDTRYWVSALASVEQGDEEPEIYEATLTIQTARARELRARH